MRDGRSSPSESVTRTRTCPVGSDQANSSILTRFGSPPPRVTVYRRKAHPVVDGARLVVRPAVARVHKVLPVRRPGGEVLVGARMSQANRLDPAGRLLTGHGVEVVVSRSVRDVRDHSPMPAPRPEPPGSWSQYG